MSQAFRSRSSLLRLAWVGLSAAWVSAIVAAPEGPVRSSGMKALYLGLSAALGVVTALLFHGRWFKRPSTAPRSLQRFQKVFFWSLAVGVVLAWAEIIRLILP